MSSEDINFKHTSLQGIEGFDSKKSYSFGFFASSRSGKTTLINYVMLKFLKDKINILMTDSAQNEIYKEPAFKKYSLVCPGFQPQLIKEAYKINKKTNNRYPFLFIMDDLVDIAKDPQILKLMTIYRNSSLGSIVSAQAPNAIVNKVGRGNIHFVFLGRYITDEACEQAVKMYLNSWFPSKMSMIDKVKKYREITSKVGTFFFINNIQGTIEVIRLNL